MHYGPTANDTAELGELARQGLRDKREPSLSARVNPSHRAPSSRQERMATKSPLQIVKEKFSDKKSLVEQVKALATEELWLSHTNHESLEKVSNAKLLRLHSLLTQVKAKFGSREKLVMAIMELEKRPKDTSFKTQLMFYPVPRLFDMWSTRSRHLEQTARASQAQATKAAPVKVSAAKSTQAAPAKGAKAAPAKKAKTAAAK